MSPAGSLHREIVLQRAYDDPTAHDGYRVLVDRFWPRGRSKEVLKLDEWARELAPSAELIRWFHHEPTNWQAFRLRYLEQLSTSETIERRLALLEAAGERKITLVYGVRNATQNQAVVLREALLASDKRGGRA